MDRNEENRRERLRRNEGTRPGPDSPDNDRTEGNRSSQSGREKGSIDKLIDRAQEKGIFEKAERFVRDKFGGGGGSGPSRRR
ncbi:hypothetical protein [Rubrobacter indicoceani]|uniref:hypothetical protein n=1 Tax=Rubrobacter indicoceani TaxID=2051957 RepID=UPI000E5AFE84|nr:hypothetical protein [Rubrobacter indicoceani]